MPRPHPPSPAETWIDLRRGEEVTHEDVITDLAGAGVIYAGEAHTLHRHHRVQLELLQALFAKGVPLVLCLEQLEARDQPAVDRYHHREIDFDQLARDIDWPKKWSNYADYRALCEFARQHRIPIRALNAPADVIRAVSRGGGLAKLPTEQRALLPADILLDDPVYERLMRLELSVHMAATDPARLRPMFEAQASRDEAMAEQIVAARRVDAGALRTALVIIGAGHARYGLGTAARVRRRDPGIVERIVLMTESGQLQLSAADRAASRDIRISHADLRAVDQPPGDFLRLLPRRSAAELPPGHPPIP
ncbi:MAG: ChaN family lipoprotein [Verrucomicrobia bacterium]|nr:ChaN family lipoprotein [Verrucomicrobiota bacterium]